VIYGLPFGSPQHLPGSHTCNSDQQNRDRDIDPLPHGGGMALFRPEIKNIALLSPTLNCQLWTVEALPPG
jgi:hypothetical protein